MRIFPMMAIPVIIYAVLAFGGGVTGHADLAGFMARGVNIRLFSGETWHLGMSDVLLVIALVMLFIEIVKATRTTSREIINHGLAMVVFVLALIFFITMRPFATSTFFLITAMCLFDVIAGYTISIVAAEHDLGVGRAGTD